MIGADEAGKGPVVGSMFAGAIRLPTEEQLPDGITDSKNLSTAQREELYTELAENNSIEIGVGEVTVPEIDDPVTNMNALTVAVQARAITDVVIEGDVVVVDAGDTDADRFGARLTNAISVDASVTAEHKADAEYAIVGAASIVAKVHRDRHIEVLSGEYGELGSGYPSDPATREFLREYVDRNGNLPACARRSWSTSQEILAESEQKDLFDF